MGCPFLGGLAERDMGKGGQKCPFLGDVLTGCCLSKTIHSKVQTRDMIFMSVIMSPGVGRVKEAISNIVRQSDNLNFQ